VLRERSAPTNQPTLVQRIAALAEALEGSDINELDLAEGDTRIVIRRRLDVPPVASVEMSVPRAGRVRRAAARPAESAGPAETGVAIVAPLTGVFYASPSPTSAPYAQVGDTVQVGQIVCIVEAMKVFNEIKSEVSGRVTAIPAQSGQLVHQGDALIRVQPA
jgi:acetyl-CoA carboxylase biotin carboxyl carrier protein